MTAAELAIHAAAVLGCNLIVAFMVARFAPAKRDWTRRSLYPLAAWVASMSAGAALTGFQVGPWGDRAYYLASLLELFLYINAAGAAVFDVLLPLLRCRVAVIARELSVGCAFVGGALYVLQSAHIVEADKLFAGSAVITVVLGLALQATLGNVVGGIALQVDDSIHIGDWVQVGPMQGKVKAIRWRYTLLETLDWDSVVIPNSSLLSQNIVILGRREGEPLQHRAWVRFNVDFRFSPARVIAVAEEALRAAPLAKIAATPAPNCLCVEFNTAAGSFAQYAVRYWLTDLAAEGTVSSAVRARLHAALRRANIPLALPASHMFMTKDNAKRAQRREQWEANRRLEAINSVDIFSAATEDERQWLADSLIARPYAAGEVAMREGDSADWLCILASGRVDVRVGSNGSEQVVASVAAPSFFGEMGLMTGESRTASVVAASEVDSYRLEKADFDEVLRRRPSLAQDLSTLLAERRLELDSAREHLDEATRRQRIQTERRRILAGIERFFGLTGGTGL